MFPPIINSIFNALFDFKKTSAEAIDSTECPFVHGQEVIVRDGPHQKWQRRTFLYYDEGNNEPYVTDAHRYKYCKDYETNAHLVDEYYDSKFI